MVDGVTGHPCHQGIRLSLRRANPQLLVWRRSRMRSNFHLTALLITSSKNASFIEISYLYLSEAFLHNQPANLHNRDMCERAMGLRGRGQPTATGSGRDPLDTSSRDSEDAGDNGRVEGAKRLSSPQHHSPLCRCNIIRKLPPSSEFRTFIFRKLFCTTDR